MPAAGCSAADGPLMSSVRTLTALAATGLLVPRGPPISAASCCSGVTLSMIHSERPMVE